MWALLPDPRSRPTWTQIDALDIDRSEGLSPEGRDGVGTIHAFRTGDVITKERTTALETGRRFSYAGGGTRIHWHGTYTVAAEMTWSFPDHLRGSTQDMANGLAAQD